MLQIHIVTLTALLAGCSVGGTYSGTIVDPMTGKPRGGEELRIVVEADPQAGDLTCQVKEGPVNPDGSFTIEGICPDTTYKLRLSDETLFVANATPIQGGEQVTGQKLEAWRAPPGAGVYILADDKLAPVRTASDLDSQQLMDTEETVTWPTQIPAKPPRVEPGQHLVIAGATMVDKIGFHPLIPHEGTIRFPTGAGKWLDVTAPAYIGYKFSSDNADEREKVTAKLDTSKVKDVAAATGDRKVRYIPVDAIAEGRYVLMGEGDKRVFIVDWGKAAEEAPEAEAKNEATEE